VGLGDWWGWGTGLFEDGEDMQVSLSGGGASKGWWGCGGSSRHWPALMVGLWRGWLVQREGRIRSDYIGDEYVSDDYVNDDHISDDHISDDDLSDDYLIDDYLSDDNISDDHSSEV
jgi:hypothetical protein